MKSKILKGITALSLVAAVFATGCSSTPKLRPSERTVAYVVEVPNTKRITRHHRAKAWLQKNYSKLNSHIEVDNKYARHIVAKGSVPCNVLKNWSDKYDYVLSFVVDVSQRNGKTDLSFEDLQIERDPKDYNKNYREKLTRNIETKQELGMVVDACLKPVKADFVNNTKFMTTRAIASERH